MDCRSPQHYHFNHCPICCFKNPYHPSERTKMSLNSENMEECASFSEHLNEIMDSTFEHSISSDENVNLSDDNQRRNGLINQLKSFNSKMLHEVCNANLEDHRDYLLQLCSRPFYNHQLGVFIDAASHNISTKMDIETVEKLKNGNEMTSTHHEIKNCTDFILRRIFDSKNDNERPSKMSPKREHFDCDLIGSDSADSVSRISARGPILRSSSIVAKSEEKNPFDLQTNSCQRKVYRCSRCHHIRKGHVCNENGDSIEYKVDAITDRYLLPGGFQENDAHYIYRVSWCGFDEENDTWEPFDSLKNCPLKFSAFKRQKMLNL